MSDNSILNFLNALSAAEAAGQAQGTLEYFDQQGKRGNEAQVTQVPQTGNFFMDTALTQKAGEAQYEAAYDRPTNAIDKASAFASGFMGGAADLAVGAYGLARTGFEGAANVGYQKELMQSPEFRNATPEQRKAMLAEAEAYALQQKANTYEDLAAASEGASNFADAFNTDAAQRVLNNNEQRAATLSNIMQNDPSATEFEKGIMGFRSGLQNGVAAANLAGQVGFDLAGGKGVDKLIGLGARGASYALGSSIDAAERLGIAAERRALQSSLANEIKGINNYKRMAGQERFDYGKAAFDPKTGKRKQGFSATFDTDEVKNANQAISDKYDNLIDDGYFRISQIQKNMEALNNRQNNLELKKFLKNLGGQELFKKVGQNRVANYLAKNAREMAGMAAVEGIQTYGTGVGQVQQEFNRISDKDFLASPEGQRLYDEELDKRRGAYSEQFDNMTQEQRNSASELIQEQALRAARNRALDEAQTNYAMSAPVTAAAFSTLGTNLTRAGNALNPFVRGAGRGAGNIAQGALEVGEEAASEYVNNELLQRFVNPYGGHVEDNSAFVAGQAAAGGAIGGAPHFARGTLQATGATLSSAGRGVASAYRAIHPAKPKQVPAATPQQQQQQQQQQVIDTLKGLEVTQPELKPQQQPQEPETPTTEAIHIDDSVLRNFEATTPEQQQVKDDILQMMDDLNQDDGSKTKEKLDAADERLTKYVFELDDENDFYDAVETLQADVKAAKISRDLSQQTQRSYNMVKDMKPGTPARVKVFKALVPLLSTNDRKDIPFTEGEMLEIIHDKTNYSRQERAAAAEAFINKGYIEDTIKKIVDETDEGYGLIKQTAQQKLSNSDSITRKSLSERVDDVIAALKEEDNLEKDRATSLSEDTQKSLRHLIGLWLSQEFRQQAFEDTEPDSDGSRKLTEAYVSYNPAQYKGRTEGRFFVRNPVEKRDAALPEKAYEAMLRENDGIRQALSVINAVTNARSNKNKGLSPIFQQIINDIVDKSDDKKLDKKAVKKAVGELTSLAHYLPEAMNLSHRDTNTLAKLVKQEQQVKHAQQKEEAAEQAQSVDEAPPQEEVSTQEEEVADKQNVEEDKQKDVDATHDEAPVEENQAPVSEKTEKDDASPKKEPDNKPKTYDLKDVPFNKIGSTLSKNLKKPLDEQLRDISRSIENLDFETEEELIKRITAISDVISNIDNNVDRARAVIYTRQKLFFKVNPEKSGLGHLSKTFQVNLLDTDIDLDDINEGLLEAIGYDKPDQIQSLRSLSFGIQKFLNDLVNKSKLNKDFIKDLKNPDASFLDGNYFKYTKDDGLKTFSRINEKGDGLEIPYTIALAAASALEMTRVDTANRSGGVLFKEDTDGETLWDEISDKEKDRLRNDKRTMDLLSHAVTEQTIVDTMSRNLRDVLGLTENNSEAEAIVRQLAATVLDFAVRNGSLARSHVVYQEAVGNKADAAHIYFSVPEIETTDNDNGGVIKKPVVDFIFDNELTNKFAEEGEQGRNFIIYNGKGEEPSWKPRKQYKRNTRTLLSDNDKEILEADAKIKFYIDKNMHKLFKDYEYNKGKISSFLQKMLGLSIPVNEIGNPIGNFYAIEATKSKINEIDRAVDLAIEVYKQYDEAGEPDNFYLNFPSDLTITNRLQTLESLSPRNNKVIRACFTNARYELGEATETTKQAENLAIAQAFGQKIEKMTLDDAKTFADKVNNIIEIAIDKNIQNIGPDADSFFNAYLHDFVSALYSANSDLLDPPSMLGYAVLEELVGRKLYEKGLTDQKPKQSYLYVEIDGKTNGAHNMLHFQSYELTPVKIGALLNTGTTFGAKKGAGYFSLQTNKDLANIVSDFRTDIYEATAKITGERLNKFARNEERDFGSNTNFNRFWNAFAMTMRAWGKGDEARAIAEQRYASNDRIDLILRRADLKYPTTAANYGASAKTMVRHMLNESEKVLVDGINDYTIKFREAMIAAQQNNEVVNAYAVMRQLERDKFDILYNYANLGRDYFFKKNLDTPVKLGPNKNTQGYPNGFPFDVGKFAYQNGYRQLDMNALTPEQANKFYEFLQNWDVLHSDLAHEVRQNVIKFAGNAMEEARTAIMGEDVTRANNYESGSQNRNVMARMAVQELYSGILDKAFNEMKKGPLADKRIMGTMLINRDVESYTPKFIDNMVRLKYLTPEQGKLLKELAPMMEFRDTTLTYGRTEMAHDRAFEISSLLNDGNKENVPYDERATSSMITYTQYKNVGVSGQAVGTIGSGDAPMAGRFVTDQNNTQFNASTVYDGVNLSINTPLIRAQKSLNQIVDGTHQRLIMAPLYLQNLALNTPENIKILADSLKAKVGKEKVQKYIDKYKKDLENINESVLNPNPFITSDYVDEDAGLVNLILANEYLPKYDEETYDSFVESQKKSFERRQKSNGGKAQFKPERDINSAALLNLFLNRYELGVHEVNYFDDEGTDIMVKQIAYRLAKYFAGYTEEQMTAISSLYPDANYVRKGYNGNFIPNEKNSPELQSNYLNYLSDRFYLTVQFELERNNGRHPFLVHGAVTPQDAEKWFAQNAKVTESTMNWQQFYDWCNSPNADRPKVENTVLPADSSTYELAEFFDTAKLRDALLSSDVFRDNKLLKHIINPARLRGIKLVLGSQDALRFKHGLNIANNVKGVTRRNYIYVNLDQVGSKPDDPDFIRDVAEVVYHELTHVYTVGELEAYFKSPSHYQKLYGDERKPLIKEYVNAASQLYQKLIENKDLLNNEIELTNAGLTAPEAEAVHSFFNNTINESMDAQTFAIEYVAYAASIPDIVYGINKLEQFNFKPRRPLIELLSKVLGYFNLKEFIGSLRKFGLKTKRANLGGYTGLLAYHILRDSQANYRGEQFYYMKSPQKGRLATINEQLERYIPTVNLVDYGKAQDRLEALADEMRLANIQFNDAEEEETFKRLYAVGLLAQETAPREFKSNITAVMSEALGSIDLTPEVGSFLREHPKEADVIFYALSQTHEPTRTAIGQHTFKNSLMKREQVLSTNYLDNAFYWFGEKFAQALDHKGNLRNKNALGLLDMAMASMTKPESKKVLSGYTRMIDKANDAVASTMGAAVNKAWSLLPGTNSNITDLAHLHDESLKFIGKHFSEGFRDIAKDLFGRNKTTDAVYTALKRSKTYVQQHRQASYDAALKLTQEAFKQPLTKKQWQALDDTFGRINLAAIDVNEAFNLYTNQEALSREIESLKSSFSKKQLQRIEDLVNFLNHGQLPKGRPLYKNAYAMAKFEDSSDIGRKKARPEDFSRMIALYNLREISAENRDILQRLNDNQGIKKIMEMQRTLQKEITSELVKSDGKGLYNHLEGDLARTKTNEKQVTVFERKDSSKAKRLGYHLIKQLHNGDGLYARDFTPRSVFNQGAIQTIAPASGNVNLYSGLNYNANFVGYLPPSAAAKSDPSLVPVFNPDGFVSGYEAVLPNYNQVQRNLSETIAYNYGKKIERETANIVNHTLLNHLLSMYNNEADKSAYVNLYDLAKKDKVVARALQNIPRPMKEEMQQATGKPKFFPVRKDMINDVMGEHLPSVGDVFTGQTRWHPKVQHAVVRYATALLGQDAYRKLTHAEEKWQDTVRAAREIIVIKSIAVPVVNAASNVVQLIINGVDPLYIARETPKKIAELETYIRAQKRTKALRARIRLGVDTPTEANKHQREIDMLNRRIRTLSIYPLIERGEFSTVDDVGISQEDVELLHNATGFIEQKIAQMDDSVLKDILRYGFITKDTPLYQGLEKLNQYSDFISKALLYDTLMARGRNRDEALLYVADEFVDYDRLAGRTRGYLESVGGLMFYNYLLRATKAGVRSIVYNPLRLALMWLSPLDPLSTGFAAGDSIMGRATFGTMNLTGLDEVATAPLNIPAAALVF